MKVNIIMYRGKSYIIAKRNVPALILFTNKQEYFIQIVCASYAPEGDVKK